MTEATSPSQKPSPLSVILSAWHDQSARILNVDLVAVGVALLLPWTTTGAIILIALWFVAVIPTLDAAAFLPALKRPICLLPVGLVVLALVGTLWSEGPWGLRLYAVGPAAKLLLMPMVFYHFERTARGPWVFNAFLISCALLMLASWTNFFEPGLTMRSDISEPGVFVKNYIDQSQEFALCAMALAYPIVRLLRQRRFLNAALLAALALSFVVNMTFVVVSRTALVAMPVMLGMFALLHLRWRGIAITLAALIITGWLAWTASPAVQGMVASSWRQYTLYETANEATSIGLRLEYWQKSIRFFKEAPLIGHGTGSIQELFEQAAETTADKTRASAGVTRNPHNQTLNVAVQWGLLGVLLLYATWLSHLRLFRGDGLASWIGLMVVVQNIVGSLFNSHLFDFTEGWMYVFGVGIAGGMMLGRDRLAN